jgi:hypothetical protein
MQFFIAITLLLTLSAAYLLRQFWSGALSDEPTAGEIAADAEPGESALKAA